MTKYCLIAMFFAAPAFAQDVFPAGTESKRAGIESVAASRSAPALLYNPANISTADSENGWLPYAELGLVQAEYSYEHADFDPVYLKLNSPVASVGTVFTTADRSWSAGFLVFPSKRGEIAVPGMPRRVGGETMALSVQSQENVFKVSYGAAARLGQSTSLGLSLVHGFENKQVTANVIGTSTPLVRQDLNNRSLRAVAGLSQQIGSSAMFNIAASSSVTKKFEGQEQRATDSAPLPSATVSYDPANVGLGLNANLAAGFAVQLSTNYRLWKNGATVIREGITSSADEAELRNVIESGLSLSVRVSDGWELLGSVAFLPSPWGDGSVATDGSNGTIGPGFGQTNLVDRRVIGAGLSGKIAQNQQVDLSVSNSSGSREISQTGASPGYYQSNVSLMSLGTTLKF